MVVIEAMACGTPVGAAARIRSRDRRPRRDGGYICEDQAELADAVRCVDRFSPRDCRQRVLGHFDTEQMTSGYESLCHLLAQRAPSRPARRAGKAPSELGATTGASKQRTYLPGRSTLTHEEKLSTPERGKRRPAETTPSRRAGGEAAQASDQPSFSGRGRPGYTDAHERVFRAVTQVERDQGAGGHLDDVARAAGLSLSETRTLLHDLSTVHGLVSTVGADDAPDMGPRYETKPGR